MCEDFVLLIASTLKFFGRKGGRMNGTSTQHPAPCQGGALNLNGDFGVEVKYGKRREGRVQGIDISRYLIEE